MFIKNQLSVRAPCDLEDVSFREVNFDQFCSSSFMNMDIILPSSFVFYIRLSERKRIWRGEHMETDNRTSLQPDKCNRPIVGLKWCWWCQQPPAQRNAAVLAVIAAVWRWWRGGRPVRDFMKPPPCDCSCTAFLDTVVLGLCEVHMSYQTHVVMMKVQRVLVLRLLQMLSPRRSQIYL